LGSTPDDAYSLQEEAEKWQTLATRQQELAMQLRQLASDQRELVAMWDAAGADDLTSSARTIEAKLRALSQQVIELEIAALERVTRAIADEAQAARALRSDSR
jgi:outer membrane murein-binding lipoprotein Lpp